MQLLKLLLSKLSLIEVASKGWGLLAKEGLCSLRKSWDQYLIVQARRLHHSLGICHRALTVAL